VKEQGWLWIASIHCNRANALKAASWNARAAPTPCHRIMAPRSVRTILEDQALKEFWLTEVSRKWDNAFRCRFLPLVDAMKIPELARIQFDFIRLSNKKACFPSVIGASGRQVTPLTEQFWCLRLFDGGRINLARIEKKVDVPFLAERVLSAGYVIELSSLSSRRNLVY